MSLTPQKFPRPARFGDSVAFGGFHAPRLLAQGAVEQSHTGDLVETTLLSVAVPPLQIDSQLLIEALWEVPNNANNKTVNYYLGGTRFRQIVLTTSVSFNDRCRLANRGATNSQVTGPYSSTPLGTSTSIIQTKAIDTSVATTLTLTCQLGNAGDTIKLHSWAVWLLMGAVA